MSDTLSAEQVAALNDPSLIDITDAEQLSSVVRAWVVADRQGTGREQFPGWWPTAEPLGEVCATAVPEVISPRRLPVSGAGSEWAKVLVAVRQSGCPAPLPGADGQLVVSSMYAVKSDDGWLLQRPVWVPRPDLPPVFSQLPDWALSPISCGGDVLLRTEVAAAWDALCAAAAGEGVELTVVDGFRSAADQAERFADAVEQLGSQEAARRFVAFADESVCASRHCAGEAVDVLLTSEADGWLSAQVGCAGGAGAEVTSRVCREGERPVLTMHRYGFAAPYPQNRAHLEFVVALPPVDGVADDCTVDPSTAVTAAVQEAWSCMLTGVGVVGDAAHATIATALAVGACGSGAGTVTGFGASQEWVDVLLGDGRVVDDPLVAAEASAVRWLEERTAGRDGWQVFPCVREGRVDPARPDLLPEWALSAAR
jgi:hypothetical protein